MNTKQEYLVEFRAMRNTLLNLNKRYNDLQSEIVKKYAPEKKTWTVTEAELFEILLSPEVEE
jgi:hypothetical protein